MKRDDDGRLLEVAVELCRECGRLSEVSEKLKFPPDGRVSGDMLDALSTAEKLRRSVEYHSMLLERLVEEGCGSVAGVVREHLERAKASMQHVRRNVLEAESQAGVIRKALREKIDAVAEGGRLLKAYRRGAC